MAIHSLLRSSRALKKSEHTVYVSRATDEHLTSQFLSLVCKTKTDGEKDLLPNASLLRLPTELISDILNMAFLANTIHLVCRSKTFPVPPVLRSCRRLRSVGLKVWRDHLETQWELCRYFKLKELRDRSSPYTNGTFTESDEWTKILDDRAANIWMLWTHALVSMGDMDLETAQYRSPLFDWRH